MSADLAKLPADEEWLRLLAVLHTGAPAIQNVLDALNYYRCLALDLAEEVSLCHGTIKAHNEILNRMHAEQVDYGDES